jgi:uncharacterized membrane protein
VRASEEQVTRFEASAVRALRAGVVAASALLLTGLVLWEVGSAAAPRVLDAGLVVLMGTPVLRVAVSAVAYLRARDWFFVATTLAVLAVLLGAIWIAWRG